MTYRSLPVQLQSMAEETKRFLLSQWGIPINSVRVELPVVPDIGFITTLHAVAKDFHWLCIEVAENAYPASLDAFILECKNRVLPIRLYVAIPAETGGNFKTDLAQARRNGVGVLEVGDHGVSVIQEALSLSLTGARTPSPKDFPAKYRQAVTGAVATFRGGNPSKGCSVLYEEIENLSRRIADKATREKWWTNLATEQAPAFKANTPWATVIDILLKRFDTAKSGCPGLTKPMFARVLGETSHRNDSAHKPKNPTQLKKRDSELRTRFESGSDLLRDLIAASRGLRV